MKTIVCFHSGNISVKTKFPKSFQWCYFNSRKSNKISKQYKKQIVIKETFTDIRIFTSFPWSSLCFHQQTYSCARGRRSRVNCKLQPHEPRFTEDDMP